ncbi:MAG: oxygen-independent coproporphyrinogen III oxidase [Flavobacteriales bacterium CG18_big_fil_WC_8_21_14_2_50_32_9]|nr:oxygen-independent coproporphyrinogen III oxidase [Flavobacteriales bacterium]PIQ15478.1 MAG: oxygen-independent coproporphyrinogen III oxidase [Flavobacteriales bacterium CG18_big_fil_WC_8_21_14_2_50_32_9]PJC63160.1 MAG: oxygen-independent coproporphyrinogen III oxidase [Flavobacteriales bacterium CG_4_9_14_0_2_um_filter_32_27]
MIDNSLIQKYNIAGPRYTSYPTVPFWDESGIDYNDWLKTLQQSFAESNKKEGISLYIHLPFCENLCTFCGCHKRITKQHNVEEPYIETVLKEWKLYCDLLPEKPLIKEIHLGGGTPTFFSPENLEQLINGIFETAEKCQKYEFSFEGHPNNTTEKHLIKLNELGFTRSSFGVQDYDPKVQKTINRIQPFEKVEQATLNSRKYGYNSVSHDLVFGLPHQTKESIINTITKTKELKPDRIAFYSYAHVPWVKGVGQRGYDENDLPSAEEKRVLYETGKQLLAELGYVEIGMDHFALPTDSMFEAMKNKTLHRNFMGYTASKTQLMIGLGMSAISDSWYSFAQNVKTVEEYTEIVNNGALPIFRGHLLTKEDLVIRKHILNIMCHFETSWEDDGMKFPELNDCLARLGEMEQDGLVKISSKGLTLPEKARPFVRNVCMAFDLRLLRNQPTTRIFSMTI